MTNKEIKNIISENKKRNTEINSYYNPITGEGSPIKRFPFFSDKTNCTLLPVEMKKLDFIQGIIKAGNITQFITDINGTCTDEMLSNFISGLSEERIKYDFEYWAITAVRIKDKISGEDIPFKLNRAQRRLLTRFEKMRIDGVPIRVILLKARQWGGSTLTQLYISWIQNVHKKNVAWNSVIVADVEDQARTVRGMYSNMAGSYPKNYGTITFRNFEGSSKNKQIAENQSIVSIGSMQRPESLRSQDVKASHLSEVGSWKKTESKSPEDLAQTIKSGIPKLPYTFIVEESTAKGVGNYFHRNWQRAESGENGYDPVFVPWFEIEMYNKPIDSYNKFIPRMEEYDLYLWEIGATLEGINWYKDFLKSELMGDHWRMKSEYPSTAVEAFQSTGHRVFSPYYVVQARKTCYDPLYKGEVYGDDKKGPEALNNIRFDNYDNGNLWVWDLPDKTENIENRYCVSVDIGGRTEKADYSIIKVIDRYWMMDGGVPEVVATWRGHLDQDLVSWKAAQIAKFYNNALLAIETNSLKTEKSEGDHFYTVLDEIEPYYENIYARTDPEKVNQGVPIRYGFHTNLSTKPMIINLLNAALRDGMYIERDLRACDEMDFFEIKKNGKYGAVDGQHDDLVMSTAIGVWISLRYMDAPFLAKKTFKSSSRKIINEATI